MRQYPKRNPINSGGRGSNALGNVLWTNDELHWLAIRCWSGRACPGAKTEQKECVSVLRVSLSAENWLTAESEPEPLPSRLKLRVAGRQRHNNTCKRFWFLGGQQNGWAGEQRGRNGESVVGASQSRSSLSCDRLSLSIVLNVVLRGDREGYYHPARFPLCNCMWLHLEL